MTTYPVNLPTSRTPYQKFRHVWGWIVVRPRRWFFGNCLWKGSFTTRWWPELRDDWDRYKYCAKIDDTVRRTDYEMIQWPNIHWVFFYKTAFRFCYWLYWDGWRPFCKWDPHRKTFPWYARFIQWIGRTTAMNHCSDVECYHCGWEGGSNYNLSEDEDGITFMLERTWTSGTPDGTDHRFSGTTICPKCGRQEYYEDGSL